jgi:hypothetical protein
VTVPREFDINSEFPRGENLLLLQHSALGVPMWHTCLVSSGGGWATPTTSSTRIHLPPPPAMTVSTDTMTSQALHVVRVRSVTCFA